MNNEEHQILSHLRLQLNVNTPDFEECWVEGYLCAQANQSEQANPFDSYTSEAAQWSEGWWAGFYGEEPLYDIEAIKMSALPSGEAANEPQWIKRSLQKWVERVGAVAATVAATALIGIMMDVI